MGKDKCLEAAGKYLLTRILLKRYLRECRKSLLHRKYEKNHDLEVLIFLELFSVSVNTCANWRNIFSFFVANQLMNYYNPTAWLLTTSIRTVTKRQRDVSHYSIKILTFS